jgi:hypothetical protein
MDFGSTVRAPSFAEAFEALIDEAMEMANMEKEPRNYLGGSRLGEDCERRLGYEFHNVAKDPERNFKGKTLRIFDMGHDGETRMAEYLRLAGFKLLTETASGGQFGFYVAKDSEGVARIAGHLDGVIIAGPEKIGPVDMVYPCLWENKALGAKSWTKTAKDGVEKSKPVYYVQMQTYMGYMALHEAPALFTALNRDTGEILAERVTFKLEAAQAASDKGVRVVTAASPEDLPRIARDSTDFRCKWCDYAGRCWSTPATPVQQQPAMPWLSAFGGAPQS